MTVYSAVDSDWPGSVQWEPLFYIFKVSLKRIKIKILNAFMTSGFNSH